MPEGRRPCPPAGAQGRHRARPRRGRCFLAHAQQPSRQPGRRQRRRRSSNQRSHSAAAAAGLPGGRQAGPGRRDGHRQGGPAGGRPPGRRLRGDRRRRAADRSSQLQFIRLDGNRPAGDETSLEIRSQEHADAEAARDDVRLFAIFLDDYHIDKAPQITIPCGPALSEFINRLWPTDLVAMMEPLTSLSALRFTRSKSELQRAVHELRRAPGRALPDQERDGRGPAGAGATSARVRAEVTLSALAALTVKLGGDARGPEDHPLRQPGPADVLGSRTATFRIGCVRSRTPPTAATSRSTPLDPEASTWRRRLGRQGHALSAGGGDRRARDRQHERLRAGC